MVVAKDIQIGPVGPDSPEVKVLIDELDAYQLSLYPAESNHLDAIEELIQDHVYFVGARRGGELCGCGAAKRMPGGYGEIKRMFVPSRFRGLGIASRILVALEAWLSTQNVSTVRLETGVRQPEAVALYRRSGYTERGPFGDYADDPLSVFMEKTL